MRNIMAGVVLGAFMFPANAQSVSARALVEITDIVGPAVSPDGRKVAFRTEQASIEGNTHETRWYVQDIDGSSPPRPLSNGGFPLRDSAGETLPMPATWSPDGHWIYYRSLIEGRVEVWRAATDGSRAEAVAQDAADIRDFSLSHDGTTLRYSIGATREEVFRAEQSEYDHGVRIDESTPIGQNLFRSGSVGGRLATQRLSSWFIRVPLLSEQPDRWKSVDLNTGTKRDLLPAEAPPNIAIDPDLGGTPDPLFKSVREVGGRRTALLRRVGDGTGLLYKPDMELSVLEKGKTLRCLAEPCIGRMITNAQWRPLSSEILFTVTERDNGQSQSILSWDVETGAVRLVVGTHGQLNGGARWAPSDCGVSTAAMICVVADASHPPRLERIDLETGERRTLFDPNMRLARDMTGKRRVQLLRWKDANGGTFSGQYFPAQTGDAPHPLFATYYDCRGFVRGGLGDEWPLATLAEQGIAALCVNAAPTRIDAIERYDAAIAALRSAIDLLAAQGEIDRKRVGMGGLSLGTEATLWTAMHSDLIKAASVSSSGISLLYYLLGSLRGDDFFVPFRRMWQAGDYGETPERWRLLSPALNLHKIRAPILMQLPEQEYIHSLDYAIPLIRDKRADLYVFPHEPHLKFQPRHKLAVYERNLDWFRFWLQGVEDADPRKAGQYKHWRMMRAKLASKDGNQAASAPSR